MTIIILVWFIVLLLLTMWCILQTGLRAMRERDEAYDYILNQWRKGLLQQPMSNRLAEKLCEYGGSQSAKP